MRRRESSPAGVEGLGPDALAPCPFDDLALPPAHRVRTFERWLALRGEWIARRTAYADQHGWPGGDLARVREEDTLHPIPDAPFDANTV